MSSSQQSAVSSQQSALSGQPTVRGTADSRAGPRVPGAEGFCQEISSVAVWSGASVTTTIRGTADSRAGLRGSGRRSVPPGNILCSGVERSDRKNNNPRPGRLARRAACPGAEGFCQEISSVAVWSGATEKTKRPPGQLGRPFLSRENSSNGGSKNHQNFLAKIL